MDPLSVAATCIGILATTAKATAAIKSYVSTYREARGDLAALLGEITDFEFLIEILRDERAGTEIEGEAGSEGGPQARLRKRILRIAVDSGKTLESLRELLDKHANEGVSQAAWWVVSGKEKVGKLQRSLERHRSVLSLTLDMIQRQASASMARDLEKLQKLLIEWRAQQQSTLNEDGGDSIDDDTAEIAAIEDLFEEITIYAESQAGSVSGKSTATTKSAATTISAATTKSETSVNPIISITSTHSSPAQSSISVPSPKQSRWKKRFSFTKRREPTPATQPIVLSSPPSAESNKSPPNEEPPPPKPTPKWYIRVTGFRTYQLEAQAKGTPSGLPYVASATLDNDVIAVLSTDASHILFPDIPVETPGPEVIPLLAQPLLVTPETVNGYEIKNRQVPRCAVCRFQSGHRFAVTLKSEKRWVLRICDMATTTVSNAIGREFKEVALPALSEINAMFFSPDGRLVAVVATTKNFESGQVVMLIDIASGRLIDDAQHPLHPGSPLAFHPSLPLLVWCSPGTDAAPRGSTGQGDSHGSPALVVWDYTTGALVNTSITIDNDSQERRQHREPQQSYGSYSDPYSNINSNPSYGYYSSGSKPSLGYYSSRSNNSYGYYSSRSNQTNNPYDRYEGGIYGSSRTNNPYNRYRGGIYGSSGTFNPYDPDNYSHTSRYRQNFGQLKFRSYPEAAETGSETLLLYVTSTKLVKVEKKGHLEDSWVEDDLYQFELTRNKKGVTRSTDWAKDVYLFALSKDERWLATLKTANHSKGKKAELCIFNTNHKFITCAIDIGVDGFATTDVKHLWFDNDDRVLMALQPNGRVRQWFLETELRST